jgi:hypothetical protein
MAREATMTPGWSPCHFGRFAGTICHLAREGRGVTLSTPPTPAIGNPCGTRVLKGLTDWRGGQSLRGNRAAAAIFLFFLFSPSKYSKHSEAAWRLSHLAEGLFSAHLRPFKSASPCLARARPRTPHNRVPAGAKRLRLQPIPPPTQQSGAVNPKISAISVGWSAPSWPIARHSPAKTGRINPSKTPNIPARFSQVAD